ncbi:uncharacterized protein H6S33_003263 [Morchella sextelata]|uniref:uncharacterized protein n=1 Tax=Morchella sextelata TaxID=1174677 RepID=UPI001D05B7EF|nr:uncharacterized protein H6S33_003263 [Morchella sextelata]KAH0607275.1 hypothetical protein H6S33_003263 [Morchella sextelata]
MPPKVSFVEPECTCPSDPTCTPTPTPTPSCHRHHPPSLDEILPNLFLGNLTAAESPSHLAKHAITHVLSVTSARPRVPQGYIHKYHNLHDDHSADLLAVLPDCVNRLEYLLADEKKEEEQKRVLVHCCMGRSRSGAVVVAYVMKARRCGVDEALAYVVGRRGGVRPNSSFVRQLRAWEGLACSPWVREERAAVVRPRVVGRAGSRRRRSVFEEEWVVVGEVGEECVGVNGGWGWGVGGLIPGVLMA